MTAGAKETSEQPSTSTLTNHGCGNEAVVMLITIPTMNGEGWASFAHGVCVNPCPVSPGLFCGSRCDDSELLLMYSVL
jgi:hypothetical protein